MLKIILTCCIAALAALIVTSIRFYLPRVQTLDSMEKLTDYSDGYNLYRMSVKYAYSLDRLVGRGITDDKSFVKAVMNEVMPLLPVKIHTPPFGCTAFHLTDSDGDAHMGRNYDFKFDTSAMLVYCAPEDGYRSVAFAALSNISANQPEESIRKKLAALTAPFICLDGMNEKGVSIAVLTLDSDPVLQNTGRPGIATTLAIRLVLDRAATTEEAVELLRGYDMKATGGRDYHYYITDASGDGRVVEYDCDSGLRELTATPSEAVTNFYILYRDRVLPERKNGIYGHGRERYDAVLAVLEAAGDSCTDKTIWEALKASSQEPNPEEITSNTQWSIAYNNTDLTAEIVVRRNWENLTSYSLDGNAVKTFR